MSHLFQPTIILLFAVLLFAGERAILAGIARDILRAVLFGLVALLFALVI